MTASTLMLPVRKFAVNHLFRNQLYQTNDAGDNPPACYGTEFQTSSVLLPEWEDRTGDGGLLQVQ